MPGIEIRPMQTEKEKDAFLRFPWKIYRSDPLWVPPILSERAETIDPERGQFFSHGEAEFFIAWSKGEAIGTICAAEDRTANQRRGVNECVFGFFDCIDDPEAASALFEAVEAWAGKRGLDTLFGPFNLDYEDGYGVLIEGRDRPPAVLCGHTPEYYQELIEDLGFEKARGDNLAFAIEVHDDSVERRRLSRLADRMRARGWVKVRGADFSEWRSEIENVYSLINPALQHLPDHIGWERETLHSTLAPFRRLADPELILFAEVDGEPVGWFPGIPNLNEALIHANGLQSPIDYVRLWWHMRRQPDCLAIKSVLVLPEYWQRGVAVLMFDEMAQRARRKGYRWADLSLTSEDNPYTPQLADRFGAKVYKKYRTYRKQVGS
jgi:GNAT superfamily N-acetyltransferase